MLLHLKHLHLVEQAHSELIHHTHALYRWTHAVQEKYLRDYECKQRGEGRDYPHCVGQGNRGSELQGVVSFLLNDAGNPGSDSHLVAPVWVESESGNIQLEIIYENEKFILVKNSLTSS